jgi:hypothetical protein
MPCERLAGLRVEVSGSNGEDRIRTCGPVLPGRVFSKDVLSATQPPLQGSRLLRLASFLASRFTKTQTGFVEVGSGRGHATATFRSEPPGYDIQCRHNAGQPAINMRLQELVLRRFLWLTQCSPKSAAERWQPNSR